MTAAKALEFEIDENLILPYFRQFITDDTPVQLHCGTAGAGKSVFFIHKAIIYCLSKKYFRLLYCRKVFDTIRGSTFQAFKDVIKEWNIESFFSYNETTMTITCTLNGNMMIAKGLDKVDKVKSIKDISHVFVDEMDQINYDDFTQLRTRLRTTKVKQTQFWGAFNPVYEFKWGREYFFADHKSDTIPFGEVPSNFKDVRIIKSNFRDNPHLPPGYEQTLIDNGVRDENKWTVYGLGNWGKSQAGNEYYNTFKSSVHVQPCKFIKGLPIHLTWDFNAMPYVALGVWQIETYEGRTKIRCIGSVAKFGSIEQTCRFFLDEYRHLCGAGVFYYGDASGANSNPTEAKNFYNIIDEYLEDVLWEDSRRLLTQNQRHKAVGKDSMGRRELMGKIFDGSLGVDVEIDPVNPELIEDLDRIRKDANGAKEKAKIKVDGQSYEELGHMSDGMDGFLGWIAVELGLIDLNRK